MMQRKKWSCLLIFGLLFLLAFPVCAAEEYQLSSENRALLEEQLEISGAEELFEKIPEDAGSLLKENGIDQIDPEKLIGFSIGDFFKNLWNIAKREIFLPVRILSTVLAVVLLCSLFQTFRTTIEDRGYAQVFTTVSVLAVCAAVIPAMTNCIARAAEAIHNCSDFILSFIPVFTGIVAAGGKPITAAGYTTAMFGTVQIISQVVSAVLVPLLGVFMALTIAGSVNHHVNMAGILSTLKTVVMWTLGFLMTVFVGLLTIKGLVSGSADTVTTKTAKFLLGSFVPVVGGALSEALNSVQSCMGLIQTTIGSLGIIVCFFIFLPLLITILLLLGTFHLSAGVADIMSVEKISGILRSAASVLSLMFGIVLMFAALLIISVTILLMIGV